MRRSSEKSFWFTGSVDEKTPGAGASRIEYLPPLHVSSQDAFKYASEQLGPLESIESMQMGEKMGEGGSYRIDSLMTARFQKKPAYVYCIVAYGKISGDGFQIAELMPYDFKITYLYVTPLPKEMEKQLGRDSHYGTSKFHDKKLTDLQNQK